MIVLDASAALELVLRTPLGRKIKVRVSDPDEPLHAPHLLDVEVAQALRRAVRLRQIDLEEAENAFDALRDLDVERHAHDLLLPRVWSLRENLTAYDATYVALAESLEATLLTCDGPLARAVPRGRRVELVE